MYINLAKVATSKIINGIIIAATALPALFGVLLICLCIGDSRVFWIAFFILPIVVGQVAIVIWRIAHISKLSRVALYNSLFEEDHDGIITYESLGSMVGLSTSKATQEFMWMNNKGYLKNITVGRTAARVDVRADKSEYKLLTCPTCGANVRVRNGGGGRCDHCGTFSRDEVNGNV